MNERNNSSRRKPEPIGVWARSFRDRLKAMSTQADQTVTDLKPKIKIESKKKPKKSEMISLDEAVEEFQRGMATLETLPTPGYVRDGARLYGIHDINNPPQETKEPFSKVLERCREAINRVEFARPATYYEENGRVFIRTLSSNG